MNIRCMITTTRSLALAVSLFSMVAFAQEGKAPPTFKNLKVLSPKVNVPELMKSFQIALGITECTYCHVKGDFASDMNPVKDTARRMIRQVRVINSLSPDQEKHVNCWTCHRGSHGSKPEYPAGTDPELAP
jgi:hypothetical protein